MSSQDIRTCRLEVLCIACGVEANDVAPENARKKFLTDGENPEMIASWKGNVQEESDGDVFVQEGSLLAQYFGHHHELVVMDPDDISIRAICCEPSCEDFVHPQVGVPFPSIEAEATLIMKQWPERRVLRMKY
jgi:hypothetical protein